MNLQTAKVMQRRRRVLLVVFILLALFYMLSTPILEASDEPFHYPVADYIAETGKLPYQDPPVKTRWKQEGSQPPLYYMLVALLITPVDRSDRAIRQVDNPHAKIGIGLARDNQNMKVHDADAEAFPYEGTTLAVMLGRLVSIACGAGTVWLVYELARLTLPAVPAAAPVAMALTAFNPMFLFITASVNNDNLVIFLGTLMLVLIVRFWRQGWAWRNILFLSFLCGLATLTKLSGLTFVPVAALAIMLVWRREKRTLGDLIFAGLVLGMGMVLIAGWWYARNIDLYSDPTGLNRMVDIAGHRPDSFGLDDLVEEREGFYYAYWGWFGGLTITAPSTFYDYVTFLYSAGLIGLIWVMLNSTVRRRFFPQPLDWLPSLILLLQVLIILGGVVRWSLQTPASQGRLLFPALGAINVLMALGIVALTAVMHEKLWQQRGKGPLVAGLLVAPLAFYAVALPLVVIRPAYTPPPTISNLPAEVQQVDVRYGDIRLLGYEIQSCPVTLAADGRGEIEIAVYWLPEARTAVPLSFYLQLFAPSPTGEAVEIAKLDSYPGRGLRRTDHWEAGKIYAETYTLAIEGASELAPFEPRLKIGWRDHKTGQEIPATTRTGEVIEAVIGRGGRVVIQEAVCPMFKNEVDVPFGDLAILRGYVHDEEVETGGIFDLTLAWKVVGETDTNYRVFVQLVDPNQPGALLGSGDNEPRAGWYPTVAWVKSDCFDDRYTVQVYPDTPPAMYRLVIGFYDPITGIRLPVLDGQGAPAGDFYTLESPVHVLGSPRESDNDNE